MVVAWHGGSPKVSTSCIEPKGNTFSPENPRKWVLTGSNLALLMSILSKAEAKIMSVELPLSIRTQWTVLLATTSRITQGVVMGVLASLQIRVRECYGVSSRGNLDTACTSITSPGLMLRRWAFLAAMDSPPPANPLEITWISPKGYWC